MDLLEAALARALNRLLERETWARERLAAFAGDTVVFRATALPTLHLTIADDGTVHASSAMSPATLTVTVKPGAFLSLPRGTDHALRELDMAGSERLAGEVLFLARHLRWDIEEDLSRVFGDALAHRMVGDARSAAAAAVDSGRRLVHALMEYALEERAMLVRRDEHDEHARANASLRDDIERLQERLERLVNG